MKFSLKKKIFASIVFNLYQVLWYLFLPIALLYFFYRSIKEPGYASNLTERLSFYRKEFKGVQDSVNKVMSLVDKGDVNFNMGSLKKVEKNDKGKVTVTLDDETTLSDIDAIFPFFGLKIELGPIADWGLNLEKNLISVNTENFETSVPRVFAVGDICIYPGKLKLILSGFHEAALAAKKMFEYCHSDKKYVFRYTTSSSDLQKKLGVK